MHFEWDLLITIGILVIIGFWVASKIKKQSLRETIDDAIALVKREE